MKHTMKAWAVLLAVALLATACAPFAVGEGAMAEAILGVDVSELAAQEASGVVYHDAGGAPADALRVLADSGVNHVRLRVWNDPTDGAGHGYGAGNIDADVAAALSARAAALGMKTLVDFHYSDFWADPTRQLAPKAWRGLDAAGKREALAAYTKEALSKILDAGGDVDMVQVGNEINNGMAGAQRPEVVVELVAAGCAAVHEVAAERGLKIAACVHLTDPQNLARLEDILYNLDAAVAEYDAVGLSFYPYWHGGLPALRTAIEAIQRRGKAAFVAETAWPFTPEDGDGWPNVIGADAEPYPESPEGQAQAFWDVCKTATDAGALGAFYWGGVWTPVGADADANRALWERFGSGWASSYAADYDPEHVGEDYGGCAWDNQALFDFDGHPLEALTGLSGLSDWEISEAGSVDPDEDAAPAGDGNLVVNPGFEDADRSMWQAESLTDDVPFDYQDFVNDAHTGTVAFHYWSEKDMDFTISQTLTGLESGVYTASLWSQGGDMRDAELTLWVEADGERYEQPFMNTKWADWQHPVIENIPVAGGTLTIGARVRCGAKGWGTLDDFRVAPAQ